MGSLGTAHLVSLLISLVAVAALCGFVAATIVRRNKRRARGYFLVGFFCGLVAGGILRKRRRGVNAIAAIARCMGVRPRMAGIPSSTGRFAVRLSPQWARQLPSRRL